MSGKISVVTGANSGIGFETAKSMSLAGSEVVMVVRSRDRGEISQKKIQETTGKSPVFAVCDLSLISEIKRLTRELNESYPKVDILVNNAGAVFAHRTITAEGHESTLAVDYLAPFTLTHLMLPSLRKATRARIINVTSGLQRQVTLHVEDLEGILGYSSMGAYSRSKLMLTMFTYHAARLLRDMGITVNAVQPGFTATNLGRRSGSLTYSIGFKIMRPIQISAAKAAEAIIYLALSPDVEGTTGKCYAKKIPITTSHESLDEAKQLLLYNTTIELLGLEPIGQ